MPNRGTVGQDQFTFKVRDELGAESDPATVLLEVNAPAPLWEIVFQATVSQGSVAPQEVWIGVYQDSTDSYDSMFDIVAPPDPQPPIFLNLYCRESRHTAWASKLRRNYPAADADSYNFVLKLRADTDPVTLSWSGADSVPKGFSSLRLVSGDTAVDLRQTDSLSIAAQDGVEQVFEVQINQQLAHTIHLSPGWNMISIPGNPVNTDPQALIGDSQTIIPILYWWNPERFTYTPINELQVGQAYWILTLSPEGEDVTLPIEPLASLSLKLKPGWNMIGGLQQSTTMVYGSENPSGSIVPHTLYSWEASMFTYWPQTSLESSRGYWLLSFQSCTFDLSSQAATAPAVSPSSEFSQDPVKSQPETLIPLTFTSGQFIQRLEIGLDRSASEGLDAMDRPMPPLSPSNRQSQVWLRGQPYKLMRDIRSLSAGSVSWPLQFSSPNAVTLSLGNDSLPEGKELLLSDGGIQTILRPGTQVRLESGSRDLTLIWRERLPEATALLQNYPNPFNPETWIPFELSRDSAVTVSIYNVAGTPVRNISVGYLQAGSYVSQSKAIYWDGKTDTGERVASGTYFYTLETAGYVSTQKMIILK